MGACCRAGLRLAIHGGYQTAGFLGRTMIAELSIRVDKGYLIGEFGVSLGMGGRESSREGGRRGDQPASRQSAMLPLR